MKLGSITELYLPASLFAAMETRIGAKSSLAGPIQTAEQVDANSWHRPFMAGVDSCARNLTHEVPLDRPFHYCLTAAPAVNAMIAKLSGFYGVAIGAGCYESFYSLASALCTHEPLRRYIQTGEEPQDLGGPAHRDRRAALGDLISGAGTMATPDGLAFGAVLCNLMGYFLMAHEIGHLALGHLPLFAEAHVTETDGQVAGDLATKRTLERDADSFAAAATVWLVGTPAFQGKWRPVFPDEQALFRAFLVGAYMLFSIMDIGRGGDVVGQQRTHPAPLVRVASMSMLLALIMHNWGGLDRDQIWETNRSAVRAVEIATAAVGGGIMDEPTATALWNEAGRAIVEHVTVMRQLLPTLDRSMLDHYAWAGSLRGTEIVGIDDADGADGTSTGGASDGALAAP